MMGTLEGGLDLRGATDREIDQADLLSRPEHHRHLA
jgi:hypothetical protein